MMAVSWEKRPAGEKAPEYLADAELFTIKIHYTIGTVETLAGFIDFCCPDLISRIELLSMCREFNLDVSECKMWWLDMTSDPSCLRKIRDDIDALTMASTVDSSKEVYVLVRIANSGQVKALNVPVEIDEEEEMSASDSGLEGLILGDNSKGNRHDADLEFHDSDYDFSNESNRDKVNTNETERVVVGIIGEPPRSVQEIDIESDYLESDEFQSCSSTDEDELISKRPKYSEFNDECDMRNPQFEIGMKFRSFKQFKEAVKNYGIRNRYVLKFKPNSQKRCKALCKKNCSFYLWASPMVKDSNTIQIKSGHLKHECARDHNNKHVNAEWITNAYLEQFRADPNWKVSGIIQAVKINQRG
ncbi:uncharacterized protein LOC120264236 [Dioscorea cayenensis subsp. rotundata]|uniref:Uncharacterized protein LOC120264236 n=1 Tax=Dioscorea cayennensis subsp. rotundata TaxID=55577 RepID=A0AB40BL27_DIOCR|nr:uncharacterized protein LOC120264236 [Dioscorea cayenensis subsp. rotundata]